ncbi:unannotated protein [freshwater metagenome]|uniref:Unannotated protein n=1 Tax=freshwater metagenome TaxID=449393 RepID=A0A6J7LR09_9ZZZZ
MDSPLNGSLGREYSPFAAFALLGGAQVRDEPISVSDESNPDPLGENQSGSAQDEKKWADEPMHERYVNECCGGRRAIPDVGIECGDEDEDDEGQAGGEVEDGSHDDGK